jgi:hypothetical protein
MGLMAIVCYLGGSVMLPNVCNCIVTFNVNIGTICAMKMIRISAILFIDLNILIYLLMYY